MPLMAKWIYRYFIIFIFMLYCRCVYAAVPPCRLLNLTFSLTLTAYSLTVDYLADHTMVRKDIVTASDSMIQMDPDGSIWFHLYTVRVKGRP